MQMLHLKRLKIIKMINTENKKYWFNLIKANTLGTRLLSQLGTTGTPKHPHSAVQEQKVVDSSST
jgi:hypothetical protein